MPIQSASPFGHALRQWRTLRHLSQLELAMRAATPSRHVSFLETGRARPTRDMVLRLAEALEVPAADCNAMLGAAGFSPQFHERPLDDAVMSSVRDVMARLLQSHAPYPGLVIDAWYDIVDMNAPAAALFTALQIAPGDGPPNLARLLLGPLRERLVNWEEVLVDSRNRLRHDLAQRPGDTRLQALLAEVEAVTSQPALRRVQVSDSPVLLTRFRTPAGVLDTLSTLVHFGGARDLTVQRLHLELIYPADAAADAILRALGEPPRSGAEHPVSHP